MNTRTPPALTPHLDYLHCRRNYGTSNRQQNQQMENGKCLEIHILYVTPLPFNKTQHKTYN